MPTITDNKIIFDHKDWLGGLHPQAGDGSPILFDGIDSASSIDPFSRLGSVKTGFNPSYDSTSSLVDGAINNIVSSSKRSSLGQASHFGAGGTKIYKIDDSDASIVVERTVTGSTMGDVASYKIGGNEGLLYSYNTATKGDIGLWNDYASFTDDYWTNAAKLNMADLDKSNPHPMIVGDDDILYIGDGNVLKSIDGEAEAGDDDALTLPSSFIIKSFAKLDNRTLIIFADKDTGARRGQINAYFWDYIKKDPYKVVPIFGAEVGGACEYSGSVGVFSKGLSNDPAQPGRDIHFLVYDGAKFKLINSIEADDIPTTGGVYSSDKFVLANLGGEIFSFGSPFSGVQAGIMPYCDLSGDYSGAVGILQNRTIIASSGAGAGNGGAEAVYKEWKTGTIRTNFGEPAMNIDTIPRVSKVRIDFESSFTGGRSFTLKLSKKDGDVIEFDEIESVTNEGTSVLLYPEQAVLRQFTEFYALQALLTWGAGDGASDGARVRKIIVEYEQITLDNN